MDLRREVCSASLESIGPIVIPDEALNAAEYSPASAGTPDTDYLATTLERMLGEDGKPFVSIRPEQKGRRGMFRGGMQCTGRVVTRG